MEANTSSTGPEPFRLFDEKPQTGFGSGFGFGFLDGPEKPLPPPPPSVEVLPSEVSSNAEFNVEPVDFDDFTLLKGRVSTKEVFGLSNSDLIPGKYEGGLKLWEGSLDLVKSLSSEMQNGQLSLTRKRVLELGCGHGLPGIFACLKGASAVHFQDFNAEVLQCLTIPNVNANFQQNLLDADDNNSTEVRFFASDWNEAHVILPHVLADDGDTKSGQKVDQAAGYDIILMAETVYSVSTLPSLYKLIKKCLRSPHGIVYLAAKKHYFGVGGGSRRFISIVEKDGILAASLISEVTDGSSNVRDVWKLHFRRRRRGRRKVDRSMASVTRMEVENSVFPSTMVKPPGSSNNLFLAGAGHRGMEIGGEFKKFTVIGVYMEESAIPFLAAKWKGKSSEELTNSVEFFRDIITGPFEKFTRVTMIAPLTGKQYSEKVAENCVAYWKEIGTYSDVDKQAIEKFLSVFQSENFPPGASILFTQSPLGTLTISFSKDDSVPETKNAVIEHKQLSEAVLESIIGENGVSPAAKCNLAKRVSELLEKTNIDENQEVRNPQSSSNWTPDIETRSTITEIEKRSTIPEIGVST